MSDVPERQIRAVYDERTIRIYQAYGDEIADAALAHGTFVSPPFGMGRMTWIKPSFLWMMYRAGWGYKDAGQRRILAIDISREGFEWALEHSCPSHPGPSLSKEDWIKMKAASPVRIQWDPERDLLLQPLSHRAIQVGIRDEAIRRYVDEWIIQITDVTALSHTMCSYVTSGDTNSALELMPKERPYIIARSVLSP